MCWSAPVSVAFAVAMGLSAYALKRVGYSGWKRSAWVLGIYGCMQFVQALNWMTIVHYSDNFTGTGVCPPQNKYATYLAYIVVTLQPLFNTLAVAAGESKERQALFRIPLCASVITCLAMLLQLVLGEMNDYPLSVPLIVADDFLATMYSEVTCTYVGPGGYLLWRFKVFLSPMLPTFYVYHLFGLLLFYISYWRPFLIFFFAHFVLALVSNAMYPESAESAAYWCTSTMCLPILLFADAWYEHRCVAQSPSLRPRHFRRIS